MLRTSKNMKTELYRRAALGLTLAVLPLMGGCETDEDGSEAGLLAAALGEPVAQSATSTNAASPPPKPEPEAVPLEAVSPARSEGSESPAEKPTPAGELTLPTFIRPGSPTAEVVKLAQSGVDAGVLLTYITNSASTFSLGADEIVYLNDLGMPSEVITTIMEHDKSLKLFWAQQAQIQPAAATVEPAPASTPETTPAEQTAAAPSYVNPPAAEPVPAEQQPVNVTYNYFYDTLSPYGSWINVDGYGMCWQPSVVVVNRGWRPYCDGGRWIYTDAGWYWYSDYTWGWAPFHYGRWLSHPTWGWCWYPGYTWGPSWVSWRYNDGYCGWAPLPPAAHYSAGFGFTYYGGSVGVSFGFGLGYDCYTFVPWNRFCNYRPSRYCAPRHHSKDIYNRTTVINNVINGDNNTVINNGVPVERVTAATKSKVEKVALRDISSRPAPGGRRERLDSDGRTLTVQRPQASHNTFTQTAPSNPEQRPVTSSPSQRPDLSPASGRTSLAVERPISRPATPQTATPQTRDSATGQEPTAITATTSPRARTIDIPSSRPTVRPTPRPASPENSVASSGQTSDRSRTVSPLIVRGTERVSEPALESPATPQVSASPRQQTARPSVVVIGRRESSGSSSQGNTPIPPAESQVPDTVRPPSRNSTVNAASDSPTYSKPTFQQREFSRPQTSIPVTRSAQPESSPRPTFSAPGQRPSAPAPSFTPRSPAPSPAPQSSRPATDSAPAVRPQPSAPAVSAPRPAPAPTPAPAARPTPSSSPSNSRSGNRNN
jgi:hypothetical protein